MAPCRGDHCKSDRREELQEVVDYLQRLRAQCVHVWTEETTAAMSVRRKRDESISVDCDVMIIGWRSYCHERLSYFKR